MNLRENIQVVLVAPRFPENIGMAARACGNMGVNRLALVNPELWPEPSCARTGETPEASSPYLEKALSLATSAGRGIVENAKVFNSLAAALSGSSLSIGATARTGGWRQGILTPAQAAELVKAHWKRAEAQHLFSARKTKAWTTRPWSNARIWSPSPPPPSLP